VCFLQNFTAISLTTSAKDTKLTNCSSISNLLQAVGSIIGRQGNHIKYIRDKSGAKINISDGSCAERIVTITGSTATINTAFQMISQKFEEVTCLFKKQFSNIQF
jgi:polyribonucleotide nucleotidyltransferase